MTCFCAILLMFLLLMAYIEIDFFLNWIEQNSLHCKWKGQLMSNTFWFRHEVLSRLLMSHCHSIDREQLSFMFLYNLSTTVIEFEKAYLPCTFFGCVQFFPCFAFCCLFINSSFFPQEFGHEKLVCQYQISKLRYRFDQIHYDYLLSWNTFQAIFRSVWIGWWS